MFFQHRKFGDLHYASVFYIDTILKNRKLTVPVASMNKELIRARLAQTPTLIY